MPVTAFWTALSVPKPQDILLTLISEGFVPDKKKNWRKGSETPISFLTHIEWFCWLKGGCWESSSACWALHKLSAKYSQAGLLLKKTLSGGTSLVATVLLTFQHSSDLTQHVYMWNIHHLLPMWIQEMWIKAFGTGDEFVLLFSVVLRLESFTFLGERGHIKLKTRHNYSAYKKYLTVLMFYPTYTNRSWSEFGFRQKKTKNFNLKVYCSIYFID